MLIQHVSFIIRVILVLNLIGKMAGGDINFGAAHLQLRHTFFILYESVENEDESTTLIIIKID